MKRRIKVLVMEDNENWQDILLENLKDAGYQVDLAETTSQAQILLKKQFYHLLILDISMDGGGAPNNDGMDLLAELDHVGLIDAVKIIMVTGYPEHMREAFRRYRVSDFINKASFDEKAFVADINELFDRHYKAKFLLKVKWSETGMEERHSNILALRSSRDAAPGILIEEFDDLLCRLFYNAECIEINDLSRNTVNDHLVFVSASYSAGGFKRFVVKVGDPSVMVREYDNFKEHVAPLFVHEPYTDAVSLRRTMRLAGIIYSFVGTTSDSFQDFETYLRQHDNASIRILLDGVFEDLLQAWFAKRSKGANLDLRGDYQGDLGSSIQMLESAASEKLNMVEKKGRIYFSDLGDDVSYSAPSSILESNSLNRDVYTCTTHGMLGPGSILIDNLERVWLIGFQNTRRSHILRDISYLDASLRLAILSAKEATLKERFELEKLLHEAKSFKDLDTLYSRVSSDERTLTKVAAAVLHLRKLAGRLAGSDIDELYISLAFSSLKMLEVNALSRVQREHALLSASISAETLNS